MFNVPWQFHPSHKEALYSFGFGFPFLSYATLALNLEVYFIVHIRLHLFVSRP